MHEIIFIFSALLVFWIIFFWRMQVWPKISGAKTHYKSRGGMPELEAWVNVPTSKESLRLHLKSMRRERASLQKTTGFSGFVLRRIAVRERKKLCENILTALEKYSPLTIAAYLPMPGEADITPAMESLHQRGWQVVLPCIEGTNTHLHFRIWHPEQPLIRGAHKIMQPASDAAEAIPHIVLVPMLGFDQAGHRLGMGAGWYDRTLQALNARDLHPELYGIAFDEQELAHIETEPHDYSMDRIITATRILESRPILKS